MVGDVWGWNSRVVAILDVSVISNWSSFEMLKKKQIRKTIALPFDEVLYDDEWITEEGYDYEVEPPQENLVLLEPNVDDAQSEEDLDGGGDDDDDDLGHFVIRGLSMDI
ncbi:hypothetical protein GmHk_04G010914 [Glycine max]|nr:hypothetical protein GmHk_04G010914 [Glycine max]